MLCFYDVTVSDLACTSNSTLLTNIADFGVLRNGGLRVPNPLISCTNDCMARKSVSQYIIIDLFLSTVFNFVFRPFIRKVHFQKVIQKEKKK